MSSTGQRRPVDCEACILTGGLSSRMGVDKATLRLGGKSLLACIRAAAKAAGLPVRVIRRDHVARCGPLGGVYTGLTTTHAQSVLFLTCDMPFVTGGLLRKLRSRLTPRKSAVFLDQGGFGFPFLARRTVLPAIRELLARREFSMHELARVLRAVPMALPRGQEQAVLNINTKQDYQRACDLLAVHPSSGFQRRRARVTAKA